mmetsp:Transcript_15016/g.27303  ORF Transcript_15016/g.27303 Transcript_15016/m.27303 type:complete len:81 (+) Transcript_15016:637-879(+)
MDFSSDDIVLDEVVEVSRLSLWMDLLDRDMLLLALEKISAWDEMRLVEIAWLMLGGWKACEDGMAERTAPERTRKAFMVA